MRKGRRGSQIPQLWTGGKTFLSCAADERDGGLANKGTALANRVRRRLVRSANRMILNDPNADDTDVVCTVQRLVIQGFFYLSFKGIDVGVFEMSA